MGGAKAKLVVRHEQVCLTSESGKLFLSADVREDGNGDLNLHWTDGSIWSRQQQMDTSRTIDSGSSRQSSPRSPSSSPSMFNKVQRTLSGKFSKRKIDHGRKAELSDAQGKWIINSSKVDDGRVEVVVDGSSVSWSTGSRAVLVAKNEQFMLTSESGKIYLTGETSAEGTLRWTNGSVWKRPAERVGESKLHLSISSAEEMPQVPTRVKV